MRVHQVKVATATISRICTDLGLPPVQRPKRRRAGRQLRLFEKKATPGESVQVDVKVGKIAGTKAYQYTACDDCTRLRVLRLYRRLNTLTSLEFLSEIVQAFPSRSGSCRLTGAPSSRSRSCWPSSGAAFATATSSRGDRARTVKSNAVTGSMPKSSGAVRPRDVRGRGRRVAGLGRRVQRTALSIALKGFTPAEKLAAVLGQAA